MIMKLCSDFYQENEVAVAKDTLFASAFNASRPGPRKIKRQGSTKKRHDLQDIMNVFLELTLAQCPNYVAKDLTKLPPLSMKNFDISNLLSEVENLRLQVGIIQEAQLQCTQANITLSGKLTPFFVATPSVHTSVRTGNQGHTSPVSEPAQKDPVLTMPAADLDNRPSDNNSTNDDDILELARIQNHAGLKKISKHKRSHSDGSHHPGDGRPASRKPDQWTERQVSPCRNVQIPRVHPRQPAETHAQTRGCRTVSWERQRSCVVQMQAQTRGCRTVSCIVTG